MSKYNWPLILHNALVSACRPARIHEVDFKAIRASITLMFYNGCDFTIFFILMHAYARTAGRFSEAASCRYRERINKNASHYLSRRVRITGYYQTRTSLLRQLFETSKNLCDYPCRRQRQPLVAAIAPTFAQAIPVAGWRRVAAANHY